MKAVAPYVVSAALLLPSSSATIGAIAEPLPATQAFYYADAASHPTRQISDSSTLSARAALEYPKAPAAYSLGYVVEDEPETYEPFIAAEAWREIPAPDVPIKIVFEGRPANFFDEHDLAVIDIYE